MGWVPRKEIPRTSSLQCIYRRRGVVGSLKYLDNETGYKRTQWMMNKYDQDVRAISVYSQA